MQYLHTTVVVDDLVKSRSFYENHLAMTRIREIEAPAQGIRATFLATKADEPSARSARFSPALALVQRTSGAKAKKGISHICFRVPDLYAICERLAAAGYRFKVPPRDGFRALVHSPEGAVIEFHQAGERRTPSEPWVSMADFN